MLTGVRWYFIVVLICISLMLSDTIISCTCWPSMSLENCSGLLSIFKSGVCFFFFIFELCKLNFHFYFWWGRGYQVIFWVFVTWHKNQFLYMFIYYLYLKRFFWGGGQHSVFSISIWLGLKKNHPVPTPNRFFLHFDLWAWDMCKAQFLLVNLSDFALLGTFQEWCLDKLLSLLMFSVLNSSSNTALSPFCSAFFLIVFQFIFLEYPVFLCVILDVPL